MNRDLRPLAQWLGWAATARSGGRLVLALICALALVAAVGQPARAEQVDYSNFDHTTTGFPLDGQHVTVKCEQCHLNGTFEGTPRACNLCHVQGNLRSAVYMPAKHIPLESKAFQAADCDRCHTTNAFQGAHFVHASVSPSNMSGVTCLSCHNNYFQTGVPSQGHPQTNATGGAALSLPESGSTASNGTSCDQCHTTGSFSSQFMTFPNGHIPTTLACQACHSAGYGVGLTQMVHTGITGNCTSCHAADAPATAPLQFTMSYGTAGGTAVVVKPTSQNYHLPTSAPPTHFTTSFSCNQCHTTPSAPMLATAAAAGFAGGVMNHTGITNGCATCHADGSGPFIGLTGSALVTLNSRGPHIPINDTACENCHKSTTVPGGFAGTAMVHTGLNGLSSCSACHENNPTDLGYVGLSQTLVVRPPTSGSQPNPVTIVDAAHPTTGECSQCHTSTTTFKTNIAKPSNHIPLTSTTGCATQCHTGGFDPTTTHMVHSDPAVASESCNSCHASGAGPFYGTSQGAGGQPQQPPGTVGTSGANNHIPVGAADCKGCHASIDGLVSTMSATGFKLSTSPLLSSTGHTAVNSLTCNTCHSSGMAWYGVTIVVPPGTVGSAGANNHIPVGSADCSACHGTTISVGAFHISATPALSSAGHTAVSAVSCASCHAAGDVWFGVTTSLVTPGSTHIVFNSGADCAPCHAKTFGTGQFHISGTPGSSPVLSATNHSYVSSTCNTCHENNGTDLLFQGVLGQIYLRPGATKTSLSIIDAAHATGPLGTGDCGQCHNTTAPFQESTRALPTAHIPLPSTAVCTTCHAAGFLPNQAIMVHSVVTTETCNTCHGLGKGPFSGTSLGTGGQPFQPPGAVGTPGSGNHIPLSTADCGSCHTSSDTETATGTGFHVSTTPQLSGTGHAAVSALSCASCHAAGDAWLGVTSLVTPGSTHIVFNSGADCAPCHAKSFGTGGFHISGTPGSSPVLSSANHSYVSTTCTNCHENNAADLLFQGVLGQIYLRPGAAVAGLSAIDAAHASGQLATNQCSQCHNTQAPFTGSQLPTNHMPLPSSGTGSVCATCHAAGYGVGKSIMVHSAVTSETCTTCHGSGKGPFAGTSQGAGGQPMQPPGTVGTSGTTNHIPVASADCGTACHASSDAMTGTGFKTNTTPALSAAGHTAVVSSLTCQSCHNTGMAWFGVTIKTPPGTPGTSGAANHIGIPSADNCNTCHANTNYVSFSGAAMNHANITSGCASCHNTGNAWYGVTNLVTKLATHFLTNSGVDCSSCHALNFATGGYKITTSPVLSTANHSFVSTTCTSCHENNAADLTFQGVGSSIYVRPGATAAGLSPADANHATGALAAPANCSGCHTTTPPFTGSTRPSNHIPSSTTCSNCHTGYTAATTTMNHSDSGVGTAGSPTACATCHGWGAGPYYGTAQGQTGGQPLQPPGTSGGAASTAQHLPFGSATCNTCHTSTTVPGGFKGTQVPHTNGPFMTYTRGSGKSNTGSSTPKCVTCHAPSGTKWYGTSFSTATMGNHHGSTTTADCVDCHSPTGGFAATATAAAKPRQAKAKTTTGITVRPTATPTVPGTAKRPTLTGTGPYSHLGVTPGSCVSCHSAAGGASAMPSGHLRTNLSCDACHRTTAWAPATYAHSGVGPGRCASCHGGPPNWATPKPAGHFLTMRSCDACHHSTSAWEPVMYDHLSPRYRPQTGMVRCIDCHTTNTEMVVSAPARTHKALRSGPIRRP
jgi:hypothetical protein